MSEDLIEYMEARRKSRNQLVAIVVGVALACGIGWAVMSSYQSKEDVRNDRTEELTRCLVDGEC